MDERPVFVKKNPWLISEQIMLSKELGCCVYSILEIMMKEEQEHKYSNFGSTYLKYRKIVIEWMIDVCDYFNLHPTTTHAAIAYLDRLQPNEKHSRFEWQMLAICCILISSKYNESESDVPDLATLEEITQQQISNDAVLNYELWALQRIGWTLSARTSTAFISSYLSAGVLFESDRIGGVSIEVHGVDKAAMEKNLTNLASMCALDESFKGVKCSLLAAAILFYARRQLSLTPEWRSELVRLTTYESKSFIDIVHKIHFACTGEAVQIDIQCPQSPMASFISSAEKLTLQSPSSPDSESSEEIENLTPGCVKNKENSILQKENMSWDSPLSVVGFAGIASCL